MIYIDLKESEQVVIGDNIKVRFVGRTNGRKTNGQFRLGFTAPREVAIVREELLPRKNREAKT